ncbi:hypothetical protein FIA58_009180 [Flavobacterium jejuense]|uniref:Uncharacterized protein n=1 Tax=Flavobacterium jejuense TaxID=1544455 RepID=A0ABX0IVM4_9FLAO|nr:hypothetical protein [Flavobacterium jejuense]NHN25845.1 hypothetical protein [Flavobacterium jejuense]
MKKKQNKNKNEFDNQLMITSDLNNIEVKDAYIFSKKDIVRPELTVYHLVNDLYCNLPIHQKINVKSYYLNNSVTSFFGMYEWELLCLIENY